jgi:uncharacterized protein
MNHGVRNPNDPIDNLAIGRIIEVDGSHIVAELDDNVIELSRVHGGETYPIGQFGSIVKIHFGRRIVYAFVGRLRMKAEFELERGIIPQSTSDERVVEADLFGEGEWLQNTLSSPSSWELKFERGVSTYPLPKQTLYLTPKSELRYIYGHGKGAVILLGEHVGSGGTPCYADMNELLGKHTAVLGSTGAGKSGTVAVILHAIIDKGSLDKYKTWNPRIIILDPHNEYGQAFPGHIRLSTDEATLTLPYWLFNFQETISLLIGKTEFIATSQANIVKTALLNARSAGAAKLKLDPKAITVDSPVPYSLDLFVKDVETQRDTISAASKHEPYNSILQKLDVLRRDSRMAFMISEWDGKKDPFPEVVRQFLGDGNPMRIVDLSGVPNEVAGAASAVIARTLFLVKVWQTAVERERSPILLVCEEAHRYVPDRGEAQYEAAQEAIRRIAKEGRKYGIGLLLISQRPSEVDATVLSQCNSWIVHRTTNESDRSHVAAVLPDSVGGLTKMLSGLRKREAIFVGQAAMLPSRILVRQLEEAQRPRSNDVDFEKGWQADFLTEEDLTKIATRWRFQKR